jgi:hypothetical protein
MLRLRNTFSTMRQAIPSYPMTMGSRSENEVRLPNLTYHRNYSQVHPVLLLMTDLCLVNTTWNAFLISFLYRTVHLSSAKQAGSLLKTLSTRMSLRPLVDTLIVTIPPQKKVHDHEADPTRRTLRKLCHRNLPCLRRLHLFTSTFQNSMVFLKDGLRGGVSLTHLTIRCHGACITMSTGYIWSILHEFLDLEEFWFEFHGDDGIKRETIRAIPENLRAPNMKKLAIRGAVLDDIAVERLCCICTGLEEMEIDGVNRFCTI